MRLTAWLLLQALAAHLDDGSNLPALPDTSPISKKEACTLTYSAAAAHKGAHVLSVEYMQLVLQAPKHPLPYETIY